MSRKNWSYFLGNIGFIKRPFFCTVIIFILCVITYYNWIKLNSYMPVKPDLVSISSLTSELGARIRTNTKLHSKLGFDETPIPVSNLSKNRGTYFATNSSHILLNYSREPNPTSSVKVSPNPKTDSTLEMISLDLSKAKYVRRLSPLAPLNQYFLHMDPPLTKAQFSELFRDGIGLEKVSLTNVVQTWQENGILYIPHNFDQNGSSRLADVFAADYEPYIPFNKSAFFQGKDHEVITQSERKIILSTLAGGDDIKDLVPLKACPTFPCVLTTNAQFYTNASAITFNAQLINGPPPKRRPDQIFIFYIYEPEEPAWSSRPSFHSKNYAWRDAFNWTMSYHMDADIFMPYGVVRRRLEPLVKDYEAILAGKRNPVAWMVSHCRTFSKREDYVRQLQRYIPVHVYGACGPFKCAREKEQACFSNISRSYKFFLSFENAMCDDYVTEKFFKFLKMDAVLVTRGSKSYYKNSPSNIFINTEDFASPKELAEHLHYLDRHNEEYLALLRNKDQYFTSYGTYPHLVGTTVWVKSNWENVPLCEVCQRLWNIDIYQKQYPDIEKWFNDRLCYPPSDLQH